MLSFITLLILVALPAADSAPRGVAAADWIPAGFHRVGGEGWTLGAPQAVAVDFYGHIYVGGGVSGKLVRVDKRFENAIQFDERETRGRFTIADLALHGFYVYLLEESRPRLLRFSNRGNFTDVLLNFSTPGNREHRTPSAIDVDSSGRILLTFSDRHEILVLNPFLDPELTFGEFGSHEYQLNSPMGVAHHPDGSYIVSDTGNHRLVKYDEFGEFIGMGRAEGLLSPRGLDVAPDGTVAVADPVAGAVFLFDPDLVPLGRAAWSEEGLDAGPQDVAFGGDDVLYAADPRRGGIQVWRRWNRDE